MSGHHGNDFRQLLADVTLRTGIEFCDRHMNQLQTTVENAVTQTGCRNVAAFRRLLESDSRAFDEFVGKLTVGETFFFRDARQFELIRDEILPEIKQRAAGRTPRFWSAGCATGEEAYSLAILLEEANPGGTGRVLATDISRQSLELARAARYRKWSLRGEKSASMRRYLRMEDDLFILDDRIRNRVEFQYLNLGENLYPSASTKTQNVDLILCRNVLIYFNRETVAAVCRRFWKSLVPGGWLVLGASDPNAAAFADFNVTDSEAGLVFRRPLSDAGKVGRHQDVSDVTSEMDDEDTIEAWNSLTHDVRRPLSGEQERLPPESRPPAGAGSRPSSPPVPADGGRETVGSTHRAPQSEAHSIERVRTLAKRDVKEAEEVCAKLVAEHRLSPELLYLHAVLLIDLGRYEESIAQLRRLIFLDRSLAIGHFTQGTVFRRLGRLADAARSFRNAVQVCESLEPADVLPLGDGETAVHLLRAAQRQLDVIASDA